MGRGRTTGWPGAFAIARAAFVLDPASAAGASRGGGSARPVGRRLDAADTRGCDPRGPLRPARLSRADVCADADGRSTGTSIRCTTARAPLRFWADVPYLDPAIGDHKIIWELNRHQHWLQLGRALWLTGDAALRPSAWSTSSTSWLAANPPLVGINWASMLELGFRSMSWIWGLHFLLGADASRPRSRTAAPSHPWLVDMLVALDRQLTHIEQNLSIYFSPNTHLTGEALALYVAGVALPELAGSRRWRDTGRRILLEEIDRQILADGGHAERSTHYHRYTLDFYLHGAADGAARR